jgi:hypothetical protein
MNELKRILLSAQYDQLAHSMFPLIKEWNDIPTALQILEVLDKCVHAGLASAAVINVLETLLENALAGEKKTLEEIVEHAHWRKEQP